MSSTSRPLHQRIFVHILPFCLALLPAINSSADDLPMAQPESVGVSSSRLDRLTKSMQRYIDSDKLAGTVSLIARKGKIIHLEPQGYKSKGNKRRDDGGHNIFHHVDDQAYCISSFDDAL